MKGRVIIVDDDTETCELMSMMISGLGYEIEAFTQGQRALEALSSDRLVTVLTDLEMDKMNGLELCERVHEIRPDLPVVLVTGKGSMENAISAMRVGAYDFLTKPVDSKLLELCLARAVQYYQLLTEIKQLKKIAYADDLKGIVGQSNPMEKVYSLVQRVASSNASVLICGETGTGKELIAKSIHLASSRKDGPFVAINCAAMPPALIESELFGHVRGAFTDAKLNRTGLFIQGNKGTIFLDEIGELPLEMQSKLLRALQERVVRPVGADADLSFDARIVTATNRDLESEVDEGRFREDLYYRINVIKIDLPPVRERGSDVLLLAQHFLHQTALKNGQVELKLSPEVAEKLINYQWPGNVREVENCMERAVALARFDHIAVVDLPEKIRFYQAERFTVSADDSTEILPIEELERRYILRVLHLLGGNKSRAAQLLGLDRRTLYRKLERYDVGSGKQPPSSLSLSPTTNSFSKFSEDEPHLVKSPD